MASANGPGGPEHETWSPAARKQLELEFARLREQRAGLAPTGDEDTVGDYADRAQALERDDDASLLDRRIDEIRELLARGPRAAGPEVVGADTLPDGTEVTVRFADRTVQTLRVVLSVEEVSDRDRETIVTPDSPLGRALCAHRVGDVVTYRTPDGMDRAELLGLRLPGDA